MLEQCYSGNLVKVGVLRLSWYTAGVFQEAVAKGVRNISFGDLSEKLGVTMYVYVNWNPFAQHPSSTVCPSSCGFMHWVGMAITYIFPNSLRIFDHKANPHSTFLLVGCMHKTTFDLRTSLLAYFEINSNVSSKVVTSLLAAIPWLLIDKVLFYVGRYKFKFRIPSYFSLVIRR